MNVTITAAGLDPLLAALGQFQTQLVPATLRVLVATRDQAARPALVEAVQRDTGLPPGLIQSAISVEDPTGESPEAVIVVAGPRIPIIDFGAQPTGSGVSYRLPGGRGFIPGGFIATMRSGHRGVFVRRQPSIRRGQGAWGLNLPIVEQRGPSVGRVVEHGPGVLEAVQQRTDQAMPAFFEREIAALTRETGLAAA